MEFSLPAQDYLLDIVKKFEVSHETDGVIIACATEDSTAEHPSTIVYVDKRCCDLFGFARQEMLGRPISDIVPMGARGFHAEKEQGFYSTSPGTKQGMRGFRVVTGQKKDGREYQITIGLERADYDGARYAIAYLKNAGPSTPSWIPGFMGDLKQQRRQEAARLQASLMVIGLATIIGSLILAGIVGYFSSDNPPDIVPPTEIFE